MRGPSALRVCDTWRPGAGDRGALAGAGPAGRWADDGGDIGDGVTSVLISSEATVVALSGSEGAGAAAGGGRAASMDTETLGPGEATMPPVHDSRLEALELVGDGVRE